MYKYAAIFVLLTVKIYEYISVQLTPVLPEPVSAAMSTSPPPSMRGIASAWISVGNL